MLIDISNYIESENNLVDNIFLTASGSLSKTKICVPLTDIDTSELERSLRSAVRMGADIVEWRADSLGGAYALTDAYIFNQIVNDCTQNISLPIIMTWRSHRDGGKKISDDEYRKIITFGILHPQIKIVDIELSFGQNDVKELVNFAHENGKSVIVSHHDFNETPNKSHLKNIMESLKNTGADVVKIALMPNIEQDVLNLLEAALEFRQDNQNLPMIAISMGKMGKISRLAADFLKLALVFASNGVGSASGQIPIATMKAICENSEEDDD